MNKPKDALPLTKSFKNIGKKLVISKFSKQISSKFSKGETSCPCSFLSKNKSKTVRKSPKQIQV